MLGWVAWIDPPISLVADNHLEEGRVLVTGPEPTGPTELI